MPTLPDVSQYQIVVYVAIGVVVLFGIAQATDKGLGPIGRAVYAFAKTRREAAAAKDDSDIADLKRQVANLVESGIKRDRQIADLQAQAEAQTQVLLAHMPWDFAAQQFALEHGGDLGTPPPLRPRVDPPAPTP